MQKYTTFRGNIGKMYETGFDNEFYEKLKVQFMKEGIFKLVFIKSKMCAEKDNVMK